MHRAAVLLISGLAMAGTLYEQQIAEWRKAREAALQAEDGWLAVAGLFWLHDGANTAGRDASNEIALPDGPEHAAVFDLHSGKVTVQVGGETRAVVPDSPDVVKIGRLSLLVIKRGDKFGVRLKDPGSEARRHFHGIDYYPADEHYRVEAKFVAERCTIPILNVLGQTEESQCPGYAVFTLGGQEMRLYPILEEPDAKTLFFIFRDLTAGKETYGAGRFLDTDLPKDGRVTLDFNKAYNPPCVFTAYATCPLPPRENHLPVRIEAGEKNVSH